MLEDRLVRLASGGFALENAYTLAEIDAFCAKKDYSFIMPMELAVKDLPVYELKDGAEWKAMLDGNALFTPELENGNVAVYDMSHTLMAVAAVADDDVVLGRQASERFEGDWRET